MKDVQLHATKDGSHTLINPTLKESYHAYNGALTESQFIYIECGLRYFLSLNTVNDQTINILEFGFGTGLNALLTLKQSIDARQAIKYSSLEPYPIPIDTAQKLNYVKKLKMPSPELFTQIHACDWGEVEEITEKFELLKIQQKLHDAALTLNSVDIIYYDAFAPSKQPDAWEKHLFEKCFQALKPNGLLVSYCANGQFKRDLKAIGFKLDQCEGPMGRREITRAWKR
ncbi:hypothetical protein D5018_02860 [Parashewanella curva]|uniref:MnmC-like methyltransferase domain-containing protein n=1 Tax=Parashewanella curva TaxID=2338552 RepID=A0A3L8Q0V7_9GAMM|nr:tRNA (5-methylaminomethyl-2-thiouridine)(34)-methyltransferase MnmD [Parashewanella curva]RLV61214.1 hypothetical protein D5018_02860 [Parashewanella curva]